MYLGELVELADVQVVYTTPRHPHTVALLSAVPTPEPRVRKKRLVLASDVPSPANPPSGCRFHTRCWLRERLGSPERCSTEDPGLRELSSGHTVACHFAEEVDGSLEQLVVTGRPVPSTAAPAGGEEAAAASETELVE